MFGSVEQIHERERTEHRMAHQRGRGDGMAEGAVDAQSDEHLRRTARPRLRLGLGDDGAARSDATATA